MRPWGGRPGEARLLTRPPLSPSPASIYSRWEVEEDWCLSVLRSYQAEHGPDFPWSVGKEALGQERGLGRVQDGGIHWAGYT